MTITLSKLLNPIQYVLFTFSVYLIYSVHLLKFMADYVYTLCIHYSYIRIRYTYVTHTLVHETHTMINATMTDRRR